MLRINVSLTTLFNTTGIRSVNDVGSSVVVFLALLCLHAARVGIWWHGWTEENVGTATTTTTITTCLPCLAWYNIHNVDFNCLVVFLMPMKWMHSIKWMRGTKKGTEHKRAREKSEREKSKVHTFDSGIPIPTESKKFLHQHIDNVCMCLPFGLIRKTFCIFLICLSHFFPLLRCMQEIYTREIEAPTSHQLPCRP